MVKGIGIDIEPVARMQMMVARYNREGLLRVFTPGELDQAEKALAPSQCLALCFSAKEAMSKALGTGFGMVDWNEIESEILEDKIKIMLSGKALRQAQSLAATRWVASWSNLEGQVVVTVLLE